MSPVGLGELLQKFSKDQDPNLLVGFETSDDAGVYRLNDDTALVTTADFITPPVDDPFLYGQIAAANSLSDVYAMGGRPITCLNLVGFPSNKLEPEVLHGIVAGALSKISEAGAVLAGGHTTEDEEPKFGLSVTGIVHPKKIWRNVGAKPGDVLILTKPIGSGVIFNANLKNWVSTDALNECIEIITTLNKAPAEVMANFEIHAATDITGFGLAGHCFEMADGSNVTLKISMDQIPVMNEALAMYEKGMSTGVNLYNRQMVGDHIRFQRDLPGWHEEIVFDPQTSGGLLVAVPKAQGEGLLHELHNAGVKQAKTIGTVTDLQNSTNLIFY
ncbi:selenide, water dikinase SelD [candidate division KSB1 bacterium]|nr:selenide, water dikinase SelD [candidate division KSB1 bacterium]